jgi:hypothetical protein
MLYRNVKKVGIVAAQTHFTVSNEREIMTLLMQIGAYEFRDVLNPVADSVSII